MEIKDATSVGGVRPTASPVQNEAGARRLPSERVSTADTSRVVDLAQAALARAGTSRADRLAQLEKAIQAGTYQPSASQTANGMIDAAKIDNAMQSIVRG
jgi:anti-sigma28 factor (negative regulator of flagellin synthesis)